MQWPAIALKSAHVWVIINIIFTGVIFPSSFTPRSYIFLWSHVISKGGGQSDVQIVDFYTIHKLQNQSPFPLVSLMIHTMQSTISDTTLTCVFSYPVIHCRIFHAFNVDFTSERRATTKRVQIITFSTFNNYSYAWDEKEKKWIPLKVEDQLRDRNEFGFQKIKKTTQIGLEASSSQLMITTRTRSMRKILMIPQTRASFLQHTWTLSRWRYGMPFGSSGWLKTPMVFSWWS